MGPTWLELGPLKVEVARLGPWVFPKVAAVVVATVVPHEGAAPLTAMLSLVHHHNSNP